MRIAAFLDKKETSKVGDKNSIIYKAVVTLLKEIKKKTGLNVAVIGTDKSGGLFEIDIDAKAK